MLEQLDHTERLSRREHRARLPYQRGRLYELQKACWDAAIPTVVLFEGWDAASRAAVGEWMECTGAGPALRSLK